MNSPSARSAKYPEAKFPPLGPGIVIIGSGSCRRKKGFPELFVSIFDSQETYFEVRIDKRTSWPQLAAWPDQHSAKSKAAPSSVSYLNKPHSNFVVRSRTQLVIQNASKRPQGHEHFGDEIVLEFGSPEECYAWESACVWAVTKHIFPELTCGRVIIHGTALISFLRLDQFEPSEHYVELTLDNFRNAQLVQRALQRTSEPQPQRTFLLNGPDWESAITISNVYDEERHLSKDVPAALIIKRARELGKSEVDLDIILEFTTVVDGKVEEADRWKQAIQYVMDDFEDQDPDAQLRSEYRATEKNEKQVAKEKKAPIVLLNDTNESDDDLPMPSVSVPTPAPAASAPALARLSASAVLQTTPSTPVQTPVDAPAPPAARTAASVTAPAAAPDSALATSSATTSTAEVTTTAAVVAPIMADPAHPAATTFASDAAANRIESAEPLHTTLGSSSSLVICVVFLVGFFIGLFLLGPGITGLLKNFIFIPFIRFILAVVHFHFLGIHQFGPFDLHVPPTLNFSSISTVLAQQVARFAY